MSDEAGTPSTLDPGTGSEQGVVNDSQASRSRDAEYWESQARSWQSRYDQAAAQRDALYTQAEETTPADTMGDEEEYDGLSVADIQGVIREELVRTRVFLSEADALRARYPDVAALAPALFEDPNAFDSPEAMRASIENLNASLEARWADREAKLRQELGAPRVNVPASPVSAEPQQSQGLPTIEQINNMSVSEMERFENQYPGLIEQITINAMQEPG